MSTPAAIKFTAHRHICPSGLIRCERGNGKPRKPKCGNCGARFHVFTGAHGVFVWRGDGQYPIADAVRLFTSPSAADRFASSDSRYVVRWITP